MPLPTFFVIGAPKAGTTSLYHYLSLHPEIFVSPVKEPGYFWTFKTPSKIQTLDEYQQLFIGSESFKAAGEGSPTYLSDAEAPYRIKDLVPDARLIAILRNPYERAHSDFRFLRLRGQETESTLLDAVRSDLKRPEQARFNYVANGLYFQNLSRFLKVFPRDQIKVVFLEDLQNRPVQFMSEIFSFLRVDPTVEVDTTERLTESGVPRFRSVQWLLSNRNPLKEMLKSSLPFVIRRALREVRSVNLVKEHLIAADRQALAPYFEADLRMLEAFLDRDLTHWHVDTIPRPSPDDRSDDGGFQSKL